MKKFIGSYYRCSFNVCLWVFLSFIGLMVLSSSAFALQWGDFTYTVSGSRVTITKYTGTGGNVVIPTTIGGMAVVGIGMSAFENCSGLTGVTIPESVTTIGYYGFENCDGLTNVIIPNSVTSIGVLAFGYCNSLTSVTIGNGVTSIGDSAFYRSNGLTSIFVDASNTVYSSQDGVLYNKAMTVLIQYPGGKSGGFTIPDSVATIRKYAFSDCTGLTSVTISNNVTSIESFAFSGCTSLASVTIGNGVINIGEWAFTGCGLTSVTIGGSVANIGSGAFVYCSGLTSVTIPNSVTSIGEGPFVYCSGLTSIVVDASNTVYSSQDGVLYNKAMTVLIQYPGGKSGGFTIPDSVARIGALSFVACTELTSVTIPNSVTNIESQAFFKCNGLTSVTIPNSVTNIMNYAFAESPTLTSVTIGSGVTSVGMGAFSGNRNLTSIFVDASNTVYSSQDGVLYNKAMTVLIQYPGGKSGGFTIPDSVATIRNDAFFDCTGLTSVTIGNGVTSIQSQAFSGCSGLTSVTIPSNVTNIMSCAFCECSNLTRAYFLGNAPSMDGDVFLSCATNFSVCYTAGSTGFTSPYWCFEDYFDEVCYFAVVCSETTPPTVIKLSSFTAIPQNCRVVLTWSTESEIDNAGFNLYRSDSENGKYTKINTSLIPSKGSSTQGTSYEFTDTNVQNRKTYYYKLEDIDLSGKSTMHGPVNATPRLIYGIGK